MSAVVEQAAPVCALCGRAGAREYLRKDGFSAFRCGDCGFVFTYPVPPKIADQYCRDYFDVYRKHREFRIRRAHRRLQDVERHILPGKLLDVGCSLGYFIEAANRRGWAAQGVEISQDASAEARTLGLDVRTGELADAGFGDSEFDCVTMWDVIEHMPDPVAQMREVARILRAGGIAALCTPDISHPLFAIRRSGWRHFKPSEHVCYYNRRTATRLLESCGFEVLRVSRGLRDVLAIHARKTG